MLPKFNKKISIFGFYFIYFLSGPVFTAWQLSVQPQCTWRPVSSKQVWKQFWRSFFPPYLLFISTKDILTLEVQSPDVRNEEASRAMRRRSADVNLQKCIHFKVKFWWNESYIILCFSWHSYVALQLLDDSVVTPSALMSSVRKTPGRLRNAACMLAVISSASIKSVVSLRYPSACTQWRHVWCVLQSWHVHTSETNSRVNQGKVHA